MDNQKYDLNVLSLGAGVQSTALYLMALNNDLDGQPDCAIFADTQWEPKEVYDQLTRLIAVGSDTIPIHIVTNGSLRDDVLNAVNPRHPSTRVANPPFYTKSAEGETEGKLWRQCTQEYKINPIERKIRELLEYKKGERVKSRVRQWFGISSDEAQRMRDSRVKWIQNYYPLIDRLISRNDCQRYLNDNDFPEVIKSSCIGCPYHSAATWVHMKRNRPEDWSDAVDFDRKMRLGNLPNVKSAAYLSRHCEPLDEAVLRDHDEDQLDLWGEECEGMCGV